MRTSKLALAALLALSVGACDSVDVPGLDRLDRIGISRKAPDEIALPDGMIVAGTKGWCIDRRSSRLDDETSVVVLGSCAALDSDAGSARPSVQGVVTVSVQAANGNVPSLQALETFFQTDAGRGILSRSGQTADVRVLETRLEDDTLILHVEDGGGAVPGASSDYWRALMGVEGRFVTVSLVGFGESPIDPDAGRAMVTAQVEELFQANQR